MPVIDTEELFRVLSDFDGYPTSGLKLAEHAKKKEASPELVQFLNAVPGQVESEADVFAAAAMPDRAPQYAADVTPSAAAPIVKTAPAQDDALHLEEVKGEEPDESK